MTATLTRTTARHSDQARPGAAAPEAPETPAAVWRHDLTLPSLRAGLAGVPTAVVAITGVVDGRTEVLVSSSFAVGISWEPALVSFSAQNTSRTWPRLRQAPTLGVSVLAADQGHLCGRLSSRTGDRLAGVPLVTAPGGTPVLAGAAGHFETVLHAEVPAGDHSVALLEVTGISEPHDGVAPLALHRGGFHGLAAL